MRFGRLASFLIPVLLVGSHSADAQKKPRPRTQAPPAAVHGPGDDLELTINEPDDWSKTGPVQTRGLTVPAKSSIRVTGVAKHPLGVAQVRLNKNLAALNELPDGATEFTGYIRVEEKMTSADVTVLTKTGIPITNHFNITPVQPPPPPPTAKEAWEQKSQSAGFSGKRYAVIIGISKYQDTTITGLKYADEDAKAFYDFLRSPLAGLGGVPPENIQLLLNEEATYRNMRVALFDFLKNAGENDVVYIYYAGHGAPDPDRRDNLYLLPYDTKAGQIGGTGFAMEDMNKALRQVMAAHKVLITDACHSGGVVTAEGTRDAFGINDINDAFLNRLSSSHGVNATFTASGPNQLSMEGEQWGGGHGVFTHYLLQGLSGEADENHDHLVDLGEIMKFVTDSVSVATKNKQVPMIGPTAFNADFPVAMVIPGQEIKQISTEEIAKFHKISSLMTAALDAAWIPPDSLTLVAGVPDTLYVRLQNDARDTIPRSILTWVSSNSGIATVENGVITPQREGIVTITASREGKKVTTLVHVLPRASDVLFKPAATDTTLVLTEHLTVQSDLLIGTGQWIRGMAPRIDMSDTLVLSQQPGQTFVAYREGTATITASIAGRTKRWNVHVIPPNVKSKPLPVALPLGDSVTLGAWRVRPDGQILGDAPGVTWRIRDTSRAIIRNGMLIPRGIGKATATVTLGNATDSVSTVILGDLLVGTSGAGGETISTLSLRSGKLVPLLPSGVEGSEPALSPKGDKIVFVSKKRLYVIDTDGSNLRRLTPDMKGMLGVRMSSYEEHSPSWTNDGARVVFISNAHGNYEVLSIAADGSDVKRYTSTSEHERSVSAAMDTPQIAYDRAVASDQSDVVVALTDGSAERVFHRDPVIGVPALKALSPKFMRGGNQLVYVRRWPDRAGESLHLMDAQTGETIKDLLPPVRDQALVYAVSPDGQRIAVHRVAEWGGGNNAILIIDRNGGQLQTVQVPGKVDIESLAWGASVPPKS